jgi:phage gp16-like protein
MSKLTISFVIALSLGAFGCKKGGGGDDAVKKMTEFKDAMCKCGDGDTACAQKVLDDQKKYGEEMAKNADKDAKPDPDMAKKMEPIMADYTKCSVKAMTPKAAAAPAAPAATPTAADPAKPSDKGSGGW